MNKGKYTDGLYKVLKVILILIIILLLLFI